MDDVAVTVWQDRSISYDEHAPWIVDRIDAEHNSNTVAVFTLEHEAIAFAKDYAAKNRLAFTETD